MSGHLIGCVKPITDLGKSQKLALVAFADSADDRTHIGFPGYEGVQEWASCSRSRAAELIDDLVTAGYLQRYRTARPGRRAEFIVFPGGCCELHRPQADEGDVDDASVAAVMAWARSAGVELEPWQAVAMAAANGSETPDLNGSEISDPSHGDGSETPDSSTISDSDESEISDASGTNGSGNGSETPDPFSTSSTTNPPTPLAECQKPGPKPHANCRGCRTTTRDLERQAETARRADELAQRRADQQRQRETALRDRAAAAASHDSATVRAAKAQLREAVSASRGR